jgi:hypothetical protein
VTAAAGGRGRSFGGGEDVGEVPHLYRRESRFLLGL